MNSVGSAHSFQIFPKPMATQTGAPRGLQMAHVFLLNHPILDDESPLSIPPLPGKSQLESWNLKRPAVNVGRLLLQWIIIRSTFFVINTSSCLFCCKLICISFKNMILSENKRLWTIHVYSCICATESWVYRPILRLGCLNAGLVWKNGTKIHWLAPTFPVETVVTWRYAPFWDTPKSWSDTVYMHVYIQKIYNYMLIMLCIHLYIYIYMCVHTKCTVSIYLSIYLRLYSKHHNISTIFVAWIPRVIPALVGFIHTLLLLLLLVK